MYDPNFKKRFVIFYNRLMEIYRSSSSQLFWINFQAWELQYLINLFEKQKVHWIINLKDKIEIARLKGSLELCLRREQLRNVIQLVEFDN